MSIKMTSDFKVEDFRKEIEAELKGRNSKLPTALFISEARTTLQDALRDKSGTLSKTSVRKVLIEAASWGFIPGRHCNFMAFATKKGKGPIDLRCSLGYKGVIELVNAADGCAMWPPEIVHEADVFKLTNRLGEQGQVTDLRHEKNVRKKSPALGFYVSWRNGDIAGVEWRDMDYINAVKKFAEGSGGYAWKGAFWYEMARKTVVLRAAKYFPIGLPEFSGDMLDQLAEEPGEAETPAPAQVAAATPAAIPDKSEDRDDTLPPADTYGTEAPFDLDLSAEQAPAAQQAARPASASRNVAGVIDDL